MSLYPAVISLSGLDGTNGFRISGAQANDFSGYSVSNAGDVNGDGFDDLIVGAPMAGPSALPAGRAYVVFGRGSGFEADFHVGDLNGNNGFRLDADFRYDRAGRSVSSAGDVNGDGFDDVIVGAPDASPHGGYSGASFVVFGKAAGFASVADLGLLDGNDGFKISGAAVFDSTGFAVGSAGDVNHDGFDDVIIGGFGADPNGEASGASYVVFGAAVFTANVDLSALDGSNGFRIAGEQSGDISGWSVSGAGDVNGDGFDDVLIGAKQADPNGESSGAAYVVFGRAGGFAASIDLSTLDGLNGFQLSGIQDGDQTGVSVSDAGDVNADGFADLIVGANAASPNGSGSGEAYVLFGSAAGFAADIQLADLGLAGLRITGEAAGYGSGYSVSSAGDFNGDGFDDLLIGAWHAGPTGVNAGAAYVVFGSEENSGKRIRLATLDGVNGFKIDGAAADDFAGISVSAAGDVNGDGLDDLIVGASQADPNGHPQAGASYVIFGAKPDGSVQRTGTAIGNNIHGGDFADKLTGLGGSDRLFGHGGNDSLIGGKARDLLDGGSGIDRLIGGGAGDRFVYGDVSDSTGIFFDTIKGCNFSGDKFDVVAPVTGVDAAIVTGTLNAAVFDSDLATAVDAAHLDAGHAVIFQPDTGDAAGRTFLIIDANTTAGYQAGEDFVIRLDDPQNLDRFNASDFI